MPDASSVLARQAQSSASTIDDAPSVLLPRASKLQSRESVRALEFSLAHSGIRELFDRGREKLPEVMAVIPLPLSSLPFHTRQRGRRQPQGAQFAARTRFDRVVPRFPRRVEVGDAPG